MKKKEKERERSIIDIIKKEKESIVIEKGIPAMKEVLIQREETMIIVRDLIRIQMALQPTKVILVLLI